MEPLWTFEKKYTENGVWMSIEIPGTNYRIEKEVHWREEGGLEYDLIWMLTESVCGKIDQTELFLIHATCRDEEGKWCCRWSYQYAPLGISLEIRGHDRLGARIELYRQMIQKTLSRRDNEVDS